MAKVNEKWVMPEWMKEYEHIINCTGGYNLEELWNDKTTSLSKNIPKVIIIASVKAQIRLLQALKEKGLLLSSEVKEQINNSKGG